MTGSSIVMAVLTRKTILASVSIIIFITYLMRFMPAEKLITPKDYNHLIDIPFQFIHVPICKQTHNFLILVHTSQSNLDRRNVLRETWANVNESNVDILFLTGLESDKGLQREMNKEMRQYKNFIQGDFMDTYRNLTYKHVMGLKYVAYHCPNIEYIVKVDDDVFVNVPVLKSFLAMYRERYGLTKNILCSTRIGHSVLREGKWAVSMKEYLNSTYPPHCPGFAIIYPMRSIELLYNAAQTMHFFWIDDVHVTGTLAKLAGVGHVDISALTMKDIELNVIKEKKLTLEMRPVLFGPMETEKEDIRSIFEYLRIHGRKASALDYLQE